MITACDTSQVKKVYFVVHMLKLILCVLRLNFDKKKPVSMLKISCQKIANRILTWKELEKTKTERLSVKIRNNPFNRTQCG